MQSKYAVQFVKSSTVLPGKYTEHRQKKDIWFGFSDNISTGFYFSGSIGKVEDKDAEKRNGSLHQALPLQEEEEETIG